MLLCFFRRSCYVCHATKESSEWQHLDRCRFVRLSRVWVLLRRLCLLSWGSDQPRPPTRACWWFSRAQVSTCKREHRRAQTEAAPLKIPRGLPRSCRHNRWELVQHQISLRRCDTHSEASAPPDPIERVAARLPQSGRASACPSRWPLTAQSAVTCRTLVFVSST